MTNRLILTLLAILTGLAAPAGTAQARNSSVNAAQVGAVCVLETIRTARRQAGLARHADGESWPLRATVGEVPYRRGPMVATFLAGIDRAHE